MRYNGHFVRFLGGTGAEARGKVEGKVNISERRLSRDGMVERRPRMERNEGEYLKSKGLA